MKLHDKIRFLRSFKGFTQQDMAEKLNLSPNAYSKVEQGKTSISVDRLGKIAQILDMPVNDIKTFDEKLVFNNFENKDSVINNYITEGFEKERESYKSHIADLQKQNEEIKKHYEKQLDEKQRIIEKLMSI